MLLLGVAACGAALAQTASEVRAKAESSLLVNGHIVVAPDGTVSSFEFDRQEAHAVTSLIKQYSSTWHFHPVLDNGKPVEARAPMHLRVVASPDGDGYRLHVVSAIFGSPSERSDEQVNPKDHSAQIALSYRASGRMTQAGSIRRSGPIRPAGGAYPTGTAYMLAHVERDGSVSHVTARQVNLDKVGPEPVMREMRKTLAEGCVRAVRQWTYNPPSAGPHKDADGWNVYVSCSLHEYEPTEKDAPENAWRTYIPGPQEPVPWLDEYSGKQKPRSLDIDALPDGGLYMVGTGLQLLNPPDQS
jgi:hypothetical protein